MEAEANKIIKQPSYRFAGYTEPWENQKLGKVVELKRGLTYKPASVVKKGIRVLRSSNIDGDTFKKKEDDVFVDENSVTIPYVQFGDILITAANGSSKLVGKHAVIEDNEKMVHGGFMLLARSKQYNFLNALLSSEWYSRFINVSVSGGNGAIGNLSKGNLEKEIVLFPSLPEQTAIGSFFQDIDQLISLQQRKLEVLKEQKKTYLKLLFPTKGKTKPALRFAGFEDGWKEVKLGEVLKKNNKKNRDLAINNVESVSNKLGFVKQTEQFEDYSVASADLSNYYVISEKQFAYNPSRINVGSIAYKKEGDTLSVVSPLYISFFTVENIDDLYLWYWFKTSLFDSQRAIYSEGGVRDTLSFNQLSDIELIFPSLPEQETIGSFFQDLDKAIAKQEEKVNQLKESKQTLLRKMFI